MLSTENPPPDLPSTDCEEIKICNISSDERASDSEGKLQVVDLFKPAGLDDKNPLPKFSIRDYVFYARGKDIKNNWPFSQKNLQLCLKHEVKDVLPPFQSLDSLRNPSSTVTCADENLSYSDVKLSESTDHSSVGQDQLAVNIENNNNSIASKEDKEFPSTTTSQSCFDINSVPPIKSSGQNQAKKCKLIVKLNNFAEPKSNQDLGMLSETTMASKVCPVCKTFTSSSNTTLNAHIDQCLSGESTIKWTANSKVIKHRIKPRKTKLMVDIYETALNCTLEDLDKRNGTNWASNLGFPAQDLEAFAKEKKKACPSVSIEDMNEEESDVYIDSNGTKLRILSKLSDVASNSSANNDCGPNKLVKKDKGPPGKKQNYLGQKQKFLKHSLYGQGSFSPSSDHLLSSRPDHCAQPEDTNGEPPECYKEDLTRPLIAYDQMKSHDLGMIKQWVGSKRTGLKKVNLEDENGHSNKTMKNLRVKTSDDVSSLVKRKNVSHSLVPLSHTESPKRKTNLLSNSHDECAEQPCEGKRPRFSVLKPLDCHGKKNHVPLSKFDNLKQSRKDGPYSVHEQHVDPPNGTKNHGRSLSRKKMEIKTSSAVNNESSQQHMFSSERKELRKTSLYHAISSGSKKLSVRHASVPESKKTLKRKHLNFEKPRLHCSSGSDEDALVVSQSKIYRQDFNLAESLGKSATQLDKGSGKPFMNRSRLKIRKKRRGFMNNGERVMTLKGFEGTGGKNLDSFPPVETSNVLEEAQMQDEFVCEQTYKIADGEANLLTFNNSLDSEFPDLARPSNADGASLHYSQAYEEIMFCADKVGKDILVSHSSHVVAEMDNNIGDEEAPRNYYADVDPIPIPGPPGSFLPSPGRIGSSEELQGNSSLTTCRIQSSSEDEREMVDMGSSHSPILNPIAAHVQHEIIQCDISDDRIEFDTPVNGSSTPFEKAASKERDLNNLQESRPNLMLPELSSREFKSTQQCCCSRKEGEYLRSGPLNNQDSQILKRDLPMGYGQLDCVSPNLSTSSPVLRLMGKNLMVVNKAENLPPQVRDSQSSMMMMVEHYPVLKSCVYRGPSTSNIENESHSFDHILSRGPPVFDNTHHSNIPVQHFGTLSSSSGFQMPADFGPSELPAHPSKVICSGRSFGGPNLIHDHQLGSKIGLDSQRTYDIEEVRTIPVSMRKNADFIGGKHKEIIIIDDSPEKESGLAIETTHCQLNTEAGFNASMAFYGNYQTRNYSLSNGSPMVHENGDNKVVPPSKGMNANLDKWNICTPQGSRVMHHPNSLSASLPPTVTTHLRSPLYFSPGFS